MVLPELIAKVAAATKEPRGVAEKLVKATLLEIETAVGDGQTVNLVGFGRFEVYDRGARVGRNLRTGSRLDIPAGRAVRFKAGKRLRSAASGEDDATDAGIAGRR